MASLLLWGVWVLVLVATLVPRPLGLTALRAAAPLGLLLAVLALPATSIPAGAAAVAGTGLAAGLALHPSVGDRFVNGAAYGEERRFLLRLPPALLLGPVPLAVVVLGAGAVAGPLLLAAGQWLAGGLAVIAGVPLVATAARSLHAVSERWAVLVPAGIVLKDPLTLVDPVLFQKHQVAALRPLPYPHAPAGDVLDLRLGAVPGSLLLELSDEATLFRTKGRRGGEPVRAQRLAFTPRSGDALLAEATRRRTAAAG